MKNWKQVIKGNETDFTIGGTAFAGGLISECELRFI